MLYDFQTKAEELLNKIGKNWRQASETRRATFKMLSDLKIVDWDTVRHTTEALENIDESWKRSEMAKNMIPFFLKALNSQNFNKVDCASWVLQYIADDSTMTLYFSAPVTNDHPFCHSFQI